MKHFICALFLVFSTQLLATELEYPELTMAPRNSERITIEAKHETRELWQIYLPIQLSAASTLTAGIMMGTDINESTDEKKISPILGMSAGGALLGLTLWMQMSYRPYLSAYQKLKAFPDKDKRQTLTRERMAEEEINAIARVGRNLRYVSFISNFTTSAFMLYASNPKTDGQITSSISLSLSFLPLIFTTQWERVASEQEKYKKRIYAPVAMTPILQSPFDQDIANGMSFTYLF
jgi:hypothetical protein